MAKINMLDPAVGNAQFMDRLVEEATRVIRSGKYISGPDVELFEKNVSRHLDVSHATACSSGTDALIMALMALDIKAGDEVICPSFTFFATSGSVSRVGATPVFVDVEYTTFNIDPNAIRAAITPKTKAIIAVHLFGQSCDMKEVMEISREFNIPVIEDACQSLGAEFGGKKVGTIGAMGCYSFFPSKNLGALGDAGLIVTNDAALDEKIKMLRNHGSKQRYYHNIVGGNFRMDTIQAAFLNVKLEFLANDEVFRMVNAQTYRERLIPLENAGHIFLPDQVYGKHVWNQFTIKVLNGQRDLLQKYLELKNISSAIYYPLPLHRQECYKHLGVSGLSATDKLAEDVLSLPIAPELSANDICEVADAISEFFMKG